MNPCWQPGCPNPAIPCYYGPPDDEYTGPDAYYCPQHAREQGFCPLCGDYWSGNTLFDFDTIGLCLHCYQELETGRAYPHSTRHDEVREKITGHPQAIQLFDETENYLQVKVRGNGE
ncbi:MAG: hypothetical protein GY796_10305 [Chloroflexi bacterium]|nr:hypothetical protein [Chloroflexota bacterium]